MKVFISHKDCDSQLAIQINNYLTRKGVITYLDALDNSIDLTRGSKELTNYLRNEIQDSTDILVIMSEDTKNSWWVPFEIGMASDQNLPIVTFLRDYVPLPEYLDYWPCIRSLNDIDKYINITKRRILRERIIEQSITKRENFSTVNSRIDKYYSELKRNLRNG